MSTAAIADSQLRIPSYRVLDVRVDAVQIPDAIQILESWIAEGSPARYVAVTGMHGVSVSRDDAEFGNILQNAGLVVADGMPLVWLGRLQGFSHMKRRVYGPELMEAFCSQTGSKYRHFFYGGAPGVADNLAQVEQERHGIQIAGTYCPPFRELSDEEEREVRCLIEEARPDVLWVGLSTPKQERWMYEHRNTLHVPVMLGVGAAFDLNTGRLKQAPAWMREHGLEWLFRLCAEPRRLWQRYMVNGSRFLWAVCVEHLLPRIF
ncbi:MAG: glycosyl transferase, WecB/TagA/CpsF family [Candidatus Sulfotelmatobacter sp.]|nr:glycosyl transferase, WecB/TagA/CpsF family [Candidatus Sulfotelmatobacter sp.]